MAFSAHKDPEQLKELFDSDEELAEKVDKIVEIIRKSKHLIFFTGAGISTSTGIPDFRGPDGVWTLRAQGKTTHAKPTTSSLKAIPSTAHMAMKKLLDEGIAKFLISQNTDGLHRRSGVDPAVLAELHGNSNLERCIKCSKEYLRDFRTRNAGLVTEHDTGRKCGVCGGELHDTIINFGENLPERELEAAFDHANKADACIVLGSSLTVTPAADCPKRVAKRGGELIICNLQRTPMDHRATVRVFAKTDDLMRRVMQKLGLEIPQFRLERRAVIRTKMEENAENKVIKWRVSVAGVDVDGTPASIFKAVRLRIKSKKNEESLEKEPFTFKGTVDASENQKILLGAPWSVKFTFFGHYLEPDLELTIPTADLQRQKSKRRVVMAYDPSTRTWIVSDEPTTPRAAASSAPVTTT